MIEKEKILSIFTFAALCHIGGVNSTLPLTYIESEMNCEVYRTNKLIMENIIIDDSYPNYASVKACWSRDNKNVSRNFKTKLLEETLIFEVRGVIWPTLPASALVTKAELNDVTPQSVWGGCSKLNSLLISGINTTLMSPDWLANCTQLRELTVTKLHLSQIYNIIKSITSRLEILHIRQTKDFHNILKYESLFKNRNLRSITEIKLIECNFDLNLGSKALSEVSTSMSIQLSSLPRLEQLYVNTAQGFDFCSSGSNSSVLFPSLRSLELSWTHLSRACFRHLRLMPQLENITIYGDVTKYIQFRELYSTARPRNLRIGHIERFIFTLDDYLNLSNNGSQKGSVTLEVLPNYNAVPSEQSSALVVDCDCVGSLWLARAVQEGLVRADPSHLVCSNGTILSKQSCERFQCDRVTCHSHCVCCRDTAHNGIFADCRGAKLATFPTELLHNNLTELLASDNAISSLPDHLPESLSLVDLSGNKIWKLSAKAVSALFASSHRRIRLARNKIDCSCDNWPLINALKRDPNKQVEDKQEIVCAQDGKSIHYINTSTCDFHDHEQTWKKYREPNLIVLVAVTVVIVVVALAVIAGYCYRQQLQIILNARGLCSCCIQRNDLNAEKYRRKKAEMSYLEKSNFTPEPNNCFENS